MNNYRSKYRPSQLYNVSGYIEANIEKKHPKKNVQKWRFKIYR